jgi:hypothetical protein
MKKLLLFCGCFLLTGCLPVFIEKQSEPLKQAVYGVNDSLTEARIDLAWFYSNQTTKLVEPPKNRINIKPLIKNEVVSTGNNKVTLSDGTRVLVLPEQYSNDEVIVVNSKAYNEILKNKHIIEQLTKEKKEQGLFIDTVNEQIKKNNEVNNKLLKSYNEAQVLIAKKDATIWHRNAIIAILLLLIGGYVALRVGIAMGKISLPFMI